MPMGLFRSSTFGGGNLLTLFVYAALGSAMFFSIAFASMMGVLLPLLFNRLNIDPAVASGPFIITMNDAFSLLIYFVMVSLLLKYLPNL